MGGWKQTDKSRKWSQWLEFEGFQRNVLGGDEEFTLEGAAGGAAAEGFFGRDARGKRVVVFLREMGKNKVARSGVEAFRIAQILADGVIGQMARAA